MSSLAVAEFLEYVAEEGLVDLVRLMFKGS